MIEFLMMLQVCLLLAAGPCWVGLSGTCVTERVKHIESLSVCAQGDHSVGLSRHTMRLQHAQQVMQA
jgi:hypothetical protein